MRTVVIGILLSALLVSPAASFAKARFVRTNRAERVDLRNVELATGEVLHGQFVNNAGQPLVGVVATIQLGKQSHKVVTDNTGRFFVSGLHGGQCLIVIGEETYACRLWAHGTAPPRSLKSIAFVDSNGEDTVLRGQGIGDRVRSLTQSQKIGLGVAVLSGTVLAIAFAQDDAS